MTSSEFADLIGVTRQQVNNYRIEGMPSVKKGSSYNYGFDAIQWLFDTGKREINRTEEVSKESLTAHERSRLADAKLKEHKLGVQKGKFILKSSVEKDISTIAITMRNKLIELPSRVIPRLDASEEVKHRINDVMTKEIKDFIIDFNTSLEDIEGV